MNGTITGISGPTVSADLVGVRLYEQVQVGHAGLIGEVVRLEPQRAVIQVYEETRGLAVGEPVTATGEALMVRLGPGLLGGMFDGLQRPLPALVARDGPFLQAGGGLFPLDLTRRWHLTPCLAPGAAVAPGQILGTVAEGPIQHQILAAAAGTIKALDGGDFTVEAPIGRLADGTLLHLWQPWPARRPRPCRRRLPVTAPLITGQRCIDLLFPLVKGGTAIFPGGFGTGKTVLEQAIAKFADVDVVVYVGCGERGNEMADLLDEFMALRDPWRGGALLERTIVIANTSNMPVAAREASIYTAVTLAEYYRDMGLQVLLLADSISRWAEALREISSSLEEMPGEEGYPTYLGSRLAAYFERAGVVETCGGGRGSLSMLLSVSPPGGDLTEPVTQACLRAAGAFFMLDAGLAHRRHFPAINWQQSYSLYAQEAVGFFSDRAADWGGLRQRCRELLRQEEALREIAEIVGPEGLQEPDRLLLASVGRIRDEFLSQNAYSDEAFSPPEATAACLRGILADHDRGVAGLAGEAAGATTGGGP
ncbi:MAG: V-type ATP synthase subunit A [Desulfuromonadales bacterium GWD2_61_12]|nr:MAG: V-type ATP synthase subunit A [Desulfuromonadales bacterium GWC2_61_20]OGR34801.1 MAG: V-type ATP synthase subunit A [Desulfuromonadales bacterium GWD2_61_12]